MPEKTYKRKQKPWDQLSYKRKHGKIKQLLGKPKFCQHCKSQSKKRYEWANIDHKYKENPKDWINLCHACHMRMDNNTPEFCNCGNKHYVKGLCEKCYNKTPKVKENLKKYKKTEKYKESEKKYLKQYRQTEKYQKYQKEYQKQYKRNTK